MRKLLLTFDVEDFVNSAELSSVYLILQMLAKYDLKALFFITGHVAEKLAASPKIVDLLKNHEIGFHSSAHSVHPTIPEYTDVKDYDEAYKIAMKRETSHIDPITGVTEGEGGLCFLRNLFKSKEIVAFRAPGMSWTPPLLEALSNLGVLFDFSSDLTISEPVAYRGITFYPYTFAQEWDGRFVNYQSFLMALLRRRIAVLDIHPSWCVNRKEWDSIFYSGNPQKLETVPQRPQEERNLIFTKFGLLLKQADGLRKTGVLEIDAELTGSHKRLMLNSYLIKKSYETSMRWPLKRFGYHPRFIFSHFAYFFGRPG